jgi:hypothetical protein
VYTSAIYSGSRIKIDEEEVSMRVRLAVLVATLAAVPAVAESKAPQIFYIPAMGAVTSPTVNYFTQFRVTNHLAREQKVRVDWIGQDGVGSRDGALTMTLGPNVTQVTTGIAVIVGTGSALGSARFVAIDDTGNADPDASISGEAVVIGLRRADDARLTETVAGIPLESMRSDDSDPRGMIFYPVPLRSMRANYGIVNDSASPDVYEVEANAIASPLTWRETVLVPAHAMVQRTLGADLGSDADSVIVTVRKLGQTSGTWTAYISSIDRITSDAVMVSPLPANGRLSP